MKVSGAIKKVLKEDLAHAGGELPAWIEPFLQTINQFIEIVGKALQTRLDFANNFYGQEVSRTFTHGVSQTITPPTGTRIKGLSVVDTGNQIVSGYGFTRSSKGTGEVAVTINFAAGGTTAATCVVQIQYG